MDGDVVITGAGNVENEVEDSWLLNQAVEYSMTSSQSDSERRQIRHDYRKLLEDLKRDQHDLTNPESDDLTGRLIVAEDLFDTVKNTREASLDAQAMSVISQFGRQKAQALNTEFVKFQPTEFAEKLMSFLTGQRVQTTDEVGISPMGWNKLGQAVQPFFKRSVPYHFMFGSFERNEPNTEGPRRRNRRKDDEKGDGEKTNVQTLNRVEQTDKHEATTVEVERVHSILQKIYESEGRQPICYFEFVINPHSFGETIENMFYVSFLVKDGHASIFLDEDKLPVIAPVSATEDERVTANAPRNQFVLQFSKPEWQGIIETFELKEPTIPSRSSHALGRHQNVGRGQNAGRSQDAGPSHADDDDSD